MEVLIVTPFLYHFAQIGRKCVKTNMVTTCNGGVNKLVHVEIVVLQFFAT